MPWSPWITQCKKSFLGDYKRFRHFAVRTSNVVNSQPSLFRPDAFYYNKSTQYKIWIRYTADEAPSNALLECANYHSAYCPAPELGDRIILEVYPKLFEESLSIEQIEDIFVHELLHERI